MGAEVGGRGGICRGGVCFLTITGEGVVFLPGLEGSLNCQSTQSAQEWASTMVATRASAADAMTEVRKSIVKVVEGV
jgi:hypothetical protein